jgi:tetratricopeptide (TPR) repeat protein
MKIKSAAIISLILSFMFCKAQDSISIKDAGDIKFKAEKLIKELNDLLAILSANDMETKEKDEIITNSYSGSANRIFKDSSVLIEDDTNPLFTKSGQSKDETASIYLHDFDLFYSKSDTRSIELTNAKSSRVKKSKNIYVKVYFNSLFKNKSSTDGTYSTTNRIAEIIASKENNKWNVLIGRIGFFNPTDTINDVLNDMALIYTNKPVFSNPADSAAAVAAQLSFEEQLTEERRQKDADDERVKQERIKQLLNKGDKALEQNDFTDALKYFTDAKEIDPLDLTVRGQISRARNLEASSAISSKQMYERLLQKAKLEENSRLYENALSDYKEAFSIKPEEQAAYDAHLKELTVKFRTISEEEEKYKAGLYKEAIKDYEKAIKKDNKNSDYYFGMGKCYDKLGEISKALKFYSQAYDLDNNNLGAIRYRAELYERTNDNFKALTDYKTYLTIDKSNTEIYERISLLHVLLNQNKEAIEDLNKAIEANPKVSHVYLSKGILQYQNKDYKSAAENFTKSIQLDSSNASAFYQRGRCMIIQNDIPHAASDFGHARAYNLDESDIKNIDALAEAIFQRSKSHFSNQKMDSALVLVEQAILINPISSLYRYELGEYYYSTRKYQEAIKSYAEAVRLNNQYNEAYYKLGMSDYNLANYSDAQENFNSALRLNPQYIQAQKSLGDTYFAMEKYSESANAMETCLKLIGNAKGEMNQFTEADIYNTMGKAYFETIIYDKALASFRNALKYHKDFAEALYYRGYTNFKKNELNDAIEDVNKALQLESGHKEWNYLLGKLYEAKKEYENAAYFFGNCVKLDSNVKYPDAIYLGGYCNYLIHNYANALPYYSKCLNLKIDSASPTFNNELGSIYLNLKKYDSSFFYYNKSYDKNAGDGIACYGIATTKLLQGKKDESLTWFEKSFSLNDPKYAEIKKDKLIADIRDDKRFKQLLKKYF